MLTPIIDLLINNNFSINNIDINLICENPKVSKIRNKIINSLSELLSINKNIINYLLSDIDSINYIVVILPL